jgi:phage terminase small subunit
MAEIQPVSSPLTNRQKRFVDLYLGECNGNAAEAARQAGFCRNNPGDARIIACKLLKKPAIRDAVEQSLEESACSSGEVLARLSAYMRGSIDLLRDCFDVDQAGRRILNLHKVHEAGVGYLIEAITPTKHGDSVRLYSAQKAAETLGRYHALWQDRIEVRHELTPEILNALSIEELELLTRDKSTPALEAKLAMLAGRQALPGTAEEAEVIDVEEVRRDA